MVSGLSQRGSTVAPSLLMHDYCGKKQKILLHGCFEFHNLEAKHGYICSHHLNSFPSYFLFRANVKTNNERKVGEKIGVSKTFVQFSSVWKRIYITLFTFWMAIVLLTIFENAKRSLPNP